MKSKYPMLIAITIVTIIWMTYLNSSKKLNKEYLTPIFKITETCQKEIKDSFYDEKIPEEISISKNKMVKLESIFGTRRFQKTGFVKFSFDGSKIISTDRAIRIWDANTCKELKYFQKHNGWISSFDLSPNGTKIAFTTSIDSNLKILDIQNIKK